MLILYVVAVCLRNHRLSKFQKINIAFLFVIYLIDMLIYFEFFGIDSDEGGNCHAFDKILTGTMDVLLYNITLLMAFKLYNVSNSFYEFTINGTLPEKKLKKRNKLIIRLIWAVSIVDLIVYVLLCIYWTFINRDINTLHVYISYNRLFGIIVMVANSALNLLSLRKFRKTLKKAKVSDKQTKIFMLKRMLISMTVLFFALSFAVVFDIYASGRNETVALVFSIFFDIIWTCITVVLLLMVLGFNIDFRLQTQTT